MSICRRKTHKLRKAGATVETGAREGALEHQNLNSENT